MVWNFPGHYRIAANVHEFLPHENLGVVYRNTCNTVHVVHNEANESPLHHAIKLTNFFTPQKLPATSVFF